MAERVRDRILALFTEHRVLRMHEIRRLLGLTAGQTAGHLDWLLRNGKLQRPARGVYLLPGSPAVNLPPSPPHNTTQRNATVWAAMTPDDRQRRVDALTAGRIAAARRRHAGDPPGPSRNPDRVLTAGELGKELGLSAGTIHYHTARGRVPSDVTAGGHHRYGLDEARQALAPYRKKGKR